MNDNKYCPFIKGTCRDDCVFKCYDFAAPGNKIYNCLIAIKLSDINEMQHNDLTDIWNAVKKG